MSSNNIPQWIESSLFENLLKETVVNFREIKDFKVKPGVKAGENYATIVLKIEIIVELQDSSTKLISYILKVDHDTEMSRKLLEHRNVFDIEAGMYSNVVYEFEKMFAESGKNVRFGAKSYELPIDKPYILLEDLSCRGFKNANRLKGLDMEHMKCVLTKLAQWHAASAVRIADKGKYDIKYMESYLHSNTKFMMKIMFESIGKKFLESAKSFQGNEEYYEAVVSTQTNEVEELYKISMADEREFNVLNHGDCWSNNIMFQYDAFGNVKETYFVDYQLPRYGTPAQDLYYVILSSAQYDLKLKSFDYFIKFYHDELLENLKFLKYTKKIPALRDIHAMLYKYGIWAYCTCTSALGVVLVDPSENVTTENMLSDSADSRNTMFTNARYRKHMEAILPWLYNRGGLSY